jgi:hypothetical protein
LRDAGYKHCPVSSSVETGMERVEKAVISRRARINVYVRISIINTAITKKL